MILLFAKLAIHLDYNNCTYSSCGFSEDVVLVGTSLEMEEATWAVETKTNWR